MTSGTDARSVRPREKERPIPKEQLPPLAFGRRFVPEPVLEMARVVRKWRARGPHLTSYAPVSTLELPSHTPSRACVPAIDFHTHLGRWLSSKGEWMQPDVGFVVNLMDSCNVASLVNLDGRWGLELEENLERYDWAHPGRFFTFCHLDWRLLNQPDGPDRLVDSLRNSVAAGARGLKIWKDLGMTVEVRGRRILPDDPMLSPVWEEAGALGIPVLIHVGDPLAFFQPVGRHNERLEELLRYPSSSRQRGGLQEFHGLIDSLEHTVASHPRTTIIGAHGFYPENLARVSEMFDCYPNFHIDVAWVAAQLGRQPRAAQALLMKHPDRVLFGTDVFPTRAGIYHAYFRLFETADEAFSYTDDPVPGSGRWPIYGLDLPHSVLEQVYRDNACRLLGLPSSGARPQAERLGAAQFQS
jgi:predicted TIM-barrel fold metal-dependent hydrolase